MTINYIEWFLKYFFLLLKIQSNLGKIIFLDLGKSSKFLLNMDGDYGDYGNYGRKKIPATLLIFGR